MIGVAHLPDDVLRKAIMSVEDKPASWFSII
jgi:hypothetical protein